jgi:hypothetical protein
MPAHRILVEDALPGRRINQPVTFTVGSALPERYWTARLSDGSTTTCQRIDAESNAESTTFVAILTFEGRIELELEAPLSEPVEGIANLDPLEKDAFARLNTGYFDLELCTGTGEGVGSSKWGIRHFASCAEGIDLLPSGNNAIGGFYGPFFTPENGLINPPEHTTVEIETVEQGAVVHHYRMHGTIPNGLLEELNGKRFTIDWHFFHNAHYFERMYTVEDFSTVINGRSVTNKITVGDEFEGGIGELVFDRFAAYNGTVYREGDPYAGLLVDMVSETLATTTSSGPKLDEFRAGLADIEAAHWDLYWRLFCVWEGALDRAEISDRLAQVRLDAHVEADRTTREWRASDQPISISDVPHQTVFAGPASKTVEFHTEAGRAMVWWTSQASGAFQIVQRRQSGWVNWGTNGENECPELPVGVTIRTAYGPFVNQWMAVADRLEAVPTTSRI